MKSNERNAPVLIFALAIIFLLVMSYIPNDTSILGYKTKPVDLFMDIKPDSLLVQNYNGQQDKPKNNIKADKSFLSSVSLSLLKQVSEKISDEKSKKEPGVDKPGVSTKDIPLTGNTSQMKYFYEALNNVKSSTVRIAHFGDSEIEGDLITADLRNNFQLKFGGEGVGFLSITSQDINFRTTTKQSFSDNWKTTNVLSGRIGTGNPDNLPIGINGFMATPEGTSWVRYETTGRYSNINSFNTVSIFYTNAKSSNIKYSFNNGSDQTARLLPGNDVKKLTLNYSSGAKSFKLTTAFAKQADFYGVSLEDGDGVYVDNFPWRGNTGLAFRDLNENALKDFEHLCNYKLIIINFGGNQVSSGDTDYEWFEKQMIKIINNLKSVFPNTSFVLVGVGDKSKKIGTRLVTDPLVLKLIETQKRIAESTGIAFWNLFEAMGGKNSMVDWADANPPLAIKDYTHITLQGAKVIADLLYKALIAGYK
jgi:hypothetical protein